MNRRLLLIDGILAVALAALVLIVSPGLAVAAIVALVVLVVCGASVLIDVRRR